MSDDEEDGLPLRSDYLATLGMGLRRGREEGAAAAFGLMGMAFAIRETYCIVCHECGYVAHNERSCQCWNDE